MSSLVDAFLGCFDDGARARGLEYHRDGRVVRVAQKGERLVGEVRGQERYQVSVDLIGLARRWPEAVEVEDIESACSCPVEWGCKHAVAVLAAWAEQHRIALDDEAEVAAEPEEAPPAVAGVPQLDRPWRGAADRDLGWMRALQERVDRPEPEPGQVLVWVLLVHGRTPELQPVALRRLKNGRPGILRRFSHVGQVLQKPLPFVDELDARVCRQLQNVYHEPPPAALLLELAAAGRLRWERHDGPELRALPELAVGAQWRRERGRLRLALVPADGADPELLLAEPPLYRRDDGIGPLDAGPLAPHLALIARMPWLEPPDAAVAAMLFGPVAPPPPEVPAPQPPVPVLHVRRATVEFFTGWRSQRAEAEFGVLGFRYGGDEVNPGSGEWILARRDGSPLVRLPRAEDARRDELRRLGLEPWPLRDVPAQAPAALRGRALFIAGTPKPGQPATPIPPTVLAALAGSGWVIDGAAAPALAAVDLGALTARAEEHDGGDWFELHLGIEVAGARIDLVPLLTPLLRGGRAAWEALPRAGGDPPAVLVPHGETLLRVPLALLQELHDRLVELFTREPGPGGGWRVDAARADLVEALDRLSPRWIGAERLRTLAERLRTCLDPAPVPAPPGLEATLRPYQLAGVAWMQRLRELGLGGVLADDMGLGKTVQAIAHLLCERAAGRADRPSLVVCPASVVGVWAGEFARFAPDVRVAVLHGANRRRADHVAADVMLTSYGTLARDGDAFAKVAWHVAIADEAQAIKNPRTGAAAAVRRLDARQRLCLTGTPVENHLGELHALLSWAAPGVLGAPMAFAKAFREPIEEGRDEARRALLRRRVAPFLLRRSKDAVARDLPPRTDIDVPVELEPRQRALYETIRLAMDARVREAIAVRGLARSGFDVIEALLRLRQVCCDPALLPETVGDRSAPAAKLAALDELLRTLVDERRPVLVFSQFTSLLDRVEEVVLRPSGIPWLRLDGGTRDRADVVARFQAGAAPVFLLSLKAGGTGLTLTTADTVILLDPWWNPAVERQAADRAHRIGQTKPVTVYRLIAQGTVEERIRALQRDKAAIAEALLDETGQAQGRLTLADIEALLAPVE